MIKYKVKWTDDHAAGDLCILNTFTGETFQYHDVSDIDWILKKVDDLNLGARVRAFPKLRLVVNNK